METVIIADGDIEYAAKLIAEGKLVAVPTETVYGLSADGLCESAVEEIYEVKGMIEGRLYAVVGKDHPLAEKGEINGAELAEEAYISLDFREAPEMMKKSLDRVQRALGYMPEKIEYARNTQTLDLLVGSGRGYTMLSGELQGFYRNATLRFLKLTGEPVYHESRLISRKDNPNPAVSHFLDIAQKLKEENERRLK